MSTFVQDSFTDSDGVALQSHTGETGATWTKVTGFSRDAQIQGNVLENLTNTDAAYYASGTPANADYEVELDYSWVNSGLATSEVLGRIDTSNGDFYSFYYRRDANQFRLRKRISSAFTTLSSASGSSPASGTYLNHRLVLSGSNLEGFVDDVSKLTATDASLSSAGKAGLAFTSPGSTAPRIRVDNYLAVNAGGGVISPNDAQHSHAGDGVVLAQVHALAIQECSHAHAAEVVGFGNAPALSVQDVGHTHPVDMVTLAQTSAIIIADGLHGHAGDGVGLGQQHLLSIWEALHGHSGDNAIVVLEGIEPPPPRVLRPTARDKTLSVDNGMTTSASARRRLQPER